MGGFAGISYDLRGASPSDYRRLNEALSARSFIKCWGIDTVWTIHIGDLADVERRFIDAVAEAGVAVEEAVVLPMSEPLVRVVDVDKHRRDSLADAIRSQFSSGIRGGE